MPRYGKRKGRRKTYKRKRSGRTKGSTGFRRRVGRVKVQNRVHRSLQVATTRQNNAKLKFVCHQTYNCNPNTGLIAGGVTHNKILTFRCSSIHDYMRENGGSLNATDSWTSQSSKYGQNVHPVNADGWDKWRLRFETYHVMRAKITVKFDVRNHYLGGSEGGYEDGAVPIFCWLRKHSKAEFSHQVYVGNNGTGLHAGNIKVMPNTTHQVLYDGFGPRSTCVLSQTYNAKKYPPLTTDGKTHITADFDHIGTMFPGGDATGSAQQSSHPDEQSFFSLGLCDAMGVHREINQSLRNVFVNIKMEWTVALRGATSIKDPIGGPLQPIPAMGSIPM